MSVTTRKLLPQELVTLATPLLEGIREHGGANCGAWVERALKLVGLTKGQPWCAAGVSLVGHVLFGSDWPVPLTGGCDEILRWAKKKGVLRKTPAPGAIFLLLKTETDAVHTGFATLMLKDGWLAEEGNTNPGGGRDGYGWFQRTRGHKEDPALTSHSYVFVYWWLA